jgi:hypothetical protein
MAFTYKLEKEDGTPADPPVLHTAVPRWDVGDTIPLDANRTLRVIETRFTDEESVLVVKARFRRSSSPAARRRRRA